MQRRTPPKATGTTTCLKIRVEYNRGRVELKIDPGSSIATLKRMIEQKTNIQMHNQVLVLPRSGVIEFSDENQAVGSVFQGNSSLHVRDASVKASQRQEHGSNQGHQWTKTIAEGTSVHQGDIIESTDVRVPQGRSFHRFGVTQSVGGDLRQGDQYITPKAPVVNSTGHRLGHQPRNEITTQGSKSGGNRYDETTTRNTMHWQGDVVHPDWVGSVPLGIGNHRHESTIATAGDLHQGHVFGKPQPPEKPI